MTLAGWLLLLVVVLVVAVFAEQWLARQRGTPSLTQPVTRRIGAVTGGIRQASVQLVQSPYEGQGTALRDWAQANLPDSDEVRAWLLKLPNQSLNVLTVQLGQFLDELNIDLLWLLRGDLDADTGLKHAVTAMVYDFCNACMQAVTVQPHVAEVRRYTDALSRLTERQSRAVARRLLTELREQELVPAAKPDILLAPESERRAYVEEMIAEANSKDRAAFQRIFERILAEEGRSEHSAVS